MKLFHLSDLHLGKRVYEFSMLADQKYILDQILDLVKTQEPDGVLLAGDIYDKAIPSTEAVALFDWFLVELSKYRKKVFLISGNHDSSERIAFGSKLMEQSGIYISPVYRGEITSISLEDDYGPIHIFLLPFLKPAHVRPYFPEISCDSYQEALHLALSQLSLNLSHRNLLVTHQYVTGAICCDSEERSIGGSDQIDVTLFDSFDYVALGHLHGPQKVERESVRYCGTPLKYSFSEINHKKSVTIVELKAKGELEIRMIPLIPKRDMQRIRGSYMEITSKPFYEKRNLEDYFYITLTDEEDIYDAVGKLRSIYGNLMLLDYDNQRTKASEPIMDIQDFAISSPFDLFCELYQKQNNMTLAETQKEILKKLLEEMEGED